jgi:hypothetical protein
MFHPDGKSIATAGRDNTARLWNAENGKELVVRSRHLSVRRFGRMGIVLSPVAGRRSQSGIPRPAGSCSPGAPTKGGWQLAFSQMASASPREARTRPPQGCGKRAGIAHDSRPWKHADVCGLQSRWKWLATQSGRNGENMERCEWAGNFPTNWVASPVLPSARMVAPCRGGSKRNRESLGYTLIAENYS